MASVDPAAAVYRSAGGTAAGPARAAGDGSSALPVRLLEVGASAGLTMLVERYGYAVGDRVLGDPGSALRFDQPWVGAPAADVDLAPQIVERRGCDPNPIDPTSDEGRLTLLSYVWPDWTERVQRLATALAVAAQAPAPVDRAGAADWLAARLATPTPGVLTVVWHSVVWQYIEYAERVEARAALLAAAARATPDAPLAHLQFEPRQHPKHGFRFELMLTMWPGPAEHELLALAPGHGVPARW
jgi:hypothetical protein